MRASRRGGRRVFPRRLTIIPPAFPRHPTFSPPSDPPLPRAAFHNDLLRFDTETSTWETVFEHLPFAAVSRRALPQAAACVQMETRHEGVCEWSLAACLAPQQGTWNPHHPGPTPTRSLLLHPKARQPHSDAVDPAQWRPGAMGYRGPDAGGCGRGGLGAQPAPHGVASGARQVRAGLRSCRREVRPARGPRLRAGFRWQQQQGQCTRKAKPVPATAKRWRSRRLSTPHLTCSDGTNCLARTAHTAELHPTKPHQILIFGECADDRPWPNPPRTKQYNACGPTRGEAFTGYSSASWLLVHAYHAHTPWLTPRRHGPCPPHAIIAHRRLRRRRRLRLCQLPCVP
jgi:hypothetical protein